MKWGERVWTREQCLNNSCCTSDLLESAPKHHTGDTASNLGNAMDELMRHQPSLRTDATKAIIKVTHDSVAEAAWQTYSALAVLGQTA